VTDEEVLTLERMEYIARDIYSQLVVECPSVVTFEQLTYDSIEKPSAKTKANSLVIRAASEGEARKAICMEAVRHKWSWQKLMLATRVRTAVFVACGVYLGTLLLGLIIRWLLPEELFLLGYLVVAALHLPPFYVMIRMPSWSEGARRELMGILFDAEGIAEYDYDHAYVDYTVLIGLAYMCLGIVAGFAVLIISGSDAEGGPIALMIVVLTIIPSMGIPIYLSSKNEKKYNRCVEYHELNIFNDDEPRGVNTPEAAELRETAAEIASLLEFESFKHEESGDPLPIEVGFREVPLPICRNCDYSFEDERILFDIQDTSISAAKRILASILVWKEIVLTRPLGAIWGTILTGIFMPLVLIVVYFFIGLYTVLVLAINLAIYLEYARRSMKSEANTRQAVREALEKTELFSPRPLIIYSRKTFSKSREFELQFIAGVVVFHVILILLMLTFT
jgi:hypothetical protein